MDKNKLQAGWSNQGFYFLLSLILLTVPLIGQEQSPASNESSRPQPPYVGTLSGDFSFVKKITYKPLPSTGSSGAAPKEAVAVGGLPPDLAELDAVKTGTLRRDRKQFVDGTSSEVWRSGILRFILNSANPTYVLLAHATPDGYQDTPDFDELKWISGDCFQGEREFQGKKCYVYQLNDQIAYINQANRLPLSFDSNAMQVSYSYQDSPSEPLKLPAAFTKKFQEVNRAWSGQPR